MPRGCRLGVYGIPVKLIVPEHVKELAVVYLVKRGPHRVRPGVANTASAFLKAVVNAAGIGELLAELFVRLNRAAKWACSLSAFTAARKGTCVEFEHEPPVDRLSKLQQRGGRTCRHGRNNLRAWRCG